MVVSARAPQCSTSAPESATRTGRRKVRARGTARPANALAARCTCCVTHLLVSKSHAPHLPCPRRANLADWHLSLFDVAGMRHEEGAYKHHKGACGNRTSPFISFWFVNLAPALPTRRLQDWWTECGGLRSWSVAGKKGGGSGGSGGASTILVTLDGMPHGVRPANGRPDSKEAGVRKTL